jgi:HSP20 family protein
MMRTDVKRTATEYVIEMEMPGIRKEDINLRAEGQTLCISIHPSESREGNKSDYVCRERFVPAVDRCLSLPDAKIDGAKAKLENGVLTIKVARQDENENVKKIVIE